MTKEKKGDRVILPFNVSCGDCNNAIDRNHYTSIAIEEASKAYEIWREDNCIKVILKP